MSGNISDGIRIQRIILQITGLWPKQHPTLYIRIFGTFTVLTTIIFVATMIAELFNLYKDYVVFTEHLSLMISPTSFLVKLIMFLRKYHQFIQLYQKLDADDFNRHPEPLMAITRKSAKVSGVVGYTYMGTCFLVCCLFCTRPLYTKVDMPVRFSYGSGSYRVLMFIFQIHGIFNAALNNSCLDVIAMYVMGIAAAQIDILNETITHFKHNCDESKAGMAKSYVHYLNQCVKHHNEIIRYIDSIEEVFSLIFLAQYLTSCALICNIGFQLVHIHGASLQFANTVFYFAAMMCQLGMYCWYGNEIIVKSTNTKLACYESNWIDCDVKVRKILIIITERSKRPLFLTAGKFSVLSLNSFTTVVNTSYTYFALMQKLYSKNND